MNNVKEALVQTKQLAELFAKRLNLLGELAQLDVQIDAASKGGGNGNGNGSLISPIAVGLAVSSTPIATTTKRRGRPKGSTNKKVSPEPTAPEMTAGKRFRNTDKSGRRLSLKELIITVCARHRNGIKLDELVRKVHDYGYMSTSDDKGFVQNIRTNLHTLINSKQVIKDADKKYHAIVPESVESPVESSEPVAEQMEPEPAMAVV